MRHLSVLAAKIASELEWFGGVCLLTLFFAQIIVVTLRYALSTGAPWAQDLLIYAFMLSVVAPVLGVILSNSSVRVDIFYASFPEHLKAWLDRVGLGLLIFPAFSFAFYNSLGSTIPSWRMLESSPTMGGLPGYFLLKAALSGFFLIVALSAGLLALKSRPYAKSGETK